MRILQGKIYTKISQEIERLLQSHKEDPKPYKYLLSKIVLSFDIDKRTHIYKLHYWEKQNIARKIIYDSFPNLRP